MNIFREKKFKWLLLDMLVFIFLAVIFGVVIDTIFPSPHEKENVWKSFFMFLVQVFIDSIVIFFLGRLYEKLVKRDPDLYYGFTLFVVLFFIVQLQLVTRLKIIYEFLNPSIQI